MRFDPADFGGPAPENPYQKLQRQAQKAAPKALKILIGIINNEQIEPRTRLTAIRELFDRAFGRPATAQETDAFVNAIQAMISDRPTTPEQWSKQHSLRQ